MFWKMIFNKPAPSESTSLALFLFSSSICLIWCWWCQWYWIFIGMLNRVQQQDLSWVFLAGWGLWGKNWGAGVGTVVWQQKCETILGCDNEPLMFMVSMENPGPYGSFSCMCSERAPHWCGNMRIFLVAGLYFPFVLKLKRFPGWSVVFLPQLFLSLLEANTRPAGMTEGKKKPTTNSKQTHKQTIPNQTPQNKNPLSRQYSLCFLLSCVQVSHLLL